MNQELWLGHCSAGDDSRGGEKREESWGAQPHRTERGAVATQTSHPHAMG